MAGELPANLETGQISKATCKTHSIELTRACWDQEPGRRITMEECIGRLQELQERYDVAISGPRSPGFFSLLHSDSISFLAYDFWDVLHERTARRVSITLVCDMSEGGPGWCATVIYSKCLSVWCGRWLTADL